MKEKTDDLDERIINTNTNDKYNIGGNQSGKTNPEKEELIDNTISAREYIEGIRDKKFPVINTAYINAEIKEKYAENFLRIMAARQLVDSVRHDPEKLKNRITLKQVNDRVAEMKNDPIFKGFLNDTLNNRFKMITAINGAKLRPGHGGKLDDMLKEYMLKLEPGMLKNDSLHKRYLPTVKDRIESIRDRIKKLNNTPSKNHEDDLKKEEMIRRAVTEIIVLRDMARADYGHKVSLEKKIPSSEKDTLKKTVDKVLENQDEHYNFICRSREVRELLLKGHGGKMTVQVRQMETQRLGDQNRALTEILNANTIKTRLEQLRTRAAELLNNINNTNPGSPERKESLTKGKMFLKEYALLALEGYNNGVNDAVISIKDVPWNEINEIRLHNTLPTRMMEVGNRIDQLKTQDVKSCLEKAASPDINGCITDLTMRMNAMVAGGQRQANPQGANPQGANPQGANPQGANPQGDNPQKHKPQMGGRGK